MKRGRSLEAILDVTPSKSSTSGSDVASPIFDAAVSLLGHGISLADCHRQCQAHVSVCDKDPMAQKFAKKGTHNLERSFHALMEKSILAWPWNHTTSGCPSLQVVRMDGDGNKSPFFDHGGA